MVGMQKISPEVVTEVIENHSLESFENAVISYYFQSNRLNPSAPYLKTRIRDSNSELVEEIRQRILQQPPCLYELIRTLELALPEEQRDGTAAYYTPKQVADYITSFAINPLNNICDPACGAGTFLLTAANTVYDRAEKPFKQIITSQIYGVDISEASVRQTKLVLGIQAEEYGEIIEWDKFQIKQADSLKTDWKTLFPEVIQTGGFDAVVGNPPYIRIQDLSEDYKSYLKRQFHTVRDGNFNLYIPFIELGMSISTHEGMVGYLIPSNYFTTLCAERLRKYLQEEKYVDQIVNFGDTLIFDDVSTYTCITFFRESQSKNTFQYTTADSICELSEITEEELVDVPYSKLNTEKWRMLSTEEFNTLSKLESFRPLDEITDVHAGVATLDNETYTVYDTGDPEYYFTEYDGEEYKVEQELCREFVKIPEITGEMSLDNNDAQLIVPYEKTVQQTLAMEPSGYSYESISPSKLATEYPHTYDYFCAVREKLETRDGGDGSEYEPWYKYGRKQGLSYIGNRLYTPTYSKSPTFIPHYNQTALFANGYGVFAKNIRLDVLQEVLNSKIMNYYVEKTSRVLEGGYYCYQKNFIRHFTVPEFTDEEADRLVNAPPTKREKILCEKYGVSEILDICEQSKTS